MKWLAEKDNLKKLIFDENKSYLEIGRIYGVSGNAVKKAALRLGFELPRKRKINPKETFGKGFSSLPIGKCIICGKEYRQYTSKSNKFCCVECANIYKHQQNYFKILNGDDSIMRANYHVAIYKKDIIAEQNDVCAICGCNQEHNNKPLVFILDHIDGNAANNQRDNLRCICPNCDSQLDTYKSKNKNGARYYYRYHKESRN